MNLKDIFQHDYNQSSCHISKCENSRCKTCPILDTSGSFTSFLTNKKYCTQGFGNLNCKTSNLIYGIVFSLCGLICVGETKGKLNKRISGHRFQINDNGGQLLYRHFNQPDHSIVSMRVVIIDKIYHHTNSPTLSTHFRRQREEFWIKTLGTASPYGCNDNISIVYFKRLDSRLFAIHFTSFIFIFDNSYKIENELTSCLQIFFWYFSSGEMLIFFIKN